MQWKAPRNGTKSITKKFALFPTRCDDGTVRWLENIRIVSEYVDFGGGGGFWSSREVMPWKEAQQCTHK